MAYATSDEFKVFIGIPTADTVDNAAITLALDAATTQIDTWCDRVFTADGAVTTRDYLVTNTKELDIDPVSTLTGLIVATDDNADGTYETTWTIGTDFRIEPVNATAAGVPWDRLVALGTRWFPKNTYRPGVRVTAKFGWPGGTVPQAVKLATLIQASRLFKRKDAPFGVAGAVEFGSELRLLNEVDRDAQNLLRRYRRQWWVA
jgi:hypothetical protein